MCKTPKVTVEDMLLSSDTSVRESLFDEEVMQAEMDALAKEAGDWRDHLLYQAARGYHYDPTIRRLQQRHVTTCGYCRTLIAVFDRGTDKEKIE